MPDASVRRQARDFDDDGPAETIVTFDDANVQSTVTNARGGRHKPRLGLPSVSFLTFGIDQSLPISITPSGYEALRVAEAADADELVCQHEPALIRHQIECLNCGQVFMPGRGRGVERGKRR